MHLKEKCNIFCVIGLVILSGVLVFINTSMSMLYSNIYITHDASIFYVIGRGMKQGLVAYKDLFDHKGLYIFLLYYIAAVIGEYKNIGVFIIYFVLTFLNSFLVYNIVSKYKNKLTSFLSAVFMIILSTSMYFTDGAMRCEHITLFTILASVYLMIVFIKNIDNFTKKDLCIILHCKAY